MEYSDEELVARYRTGDRQAFEVIYERYLPLLFDKIYKRLKNRDNTEDILQDVFTRFWCNRESLKITVLSAYLQNAVRNETINFLTRSKVHIPLIESIYEFHQADNGPFEHVQSKELLKLIHAYADTLPAKRRQIFLLRFVNRLSTNEIAEGLGLNQKTVQNQLGIAVKGFDVSLFVLFLALNVLGK